MSKPFIKTLDLIGLLSLSVLIILFLPVIVFLLFWFLIGRVLLGNDKFVITGEKQYVFIEKSNVVFQTTRIKNINYKNGDGNLEIIWQNNEALINVYGITPKFNGYAWDGCSPKFQVFDIVIGTPDGVINSGTEKPSAYYASMVHDIIYQYHWFIKDGITRKQVDTIFLDELRKQGFRLAYGYYLNVRIFGWVYWYSKRKNIS